MMLIQGDPLRRRGLTEHRLSQVAGDMRIAAARTVPHDGRGPIPLSCFRDLVYAGIRICFTRDIEMHTSGWFKNPQFERCRHLSIGFRDPATGLPAPFDRYVAERMARAFFDDETTKIWTETAKSDGGKALGIVHYRVFCDEHWNAIAPVGEVYSRELTEKGWQSWSDQHGDDPEPSSLHAG